MKIRTLYISFLLCIASLLIAQDYQDTVFTHKGDTLLGKITINKEKNKFFFANDTLKESTLLADSVRSFVMYSKEFDYDRKQYFSLLNQFYELEFGKNAYITVYTKTSYKTSEEYGQKYYTAKKEYCFIKDGSPFFYNVDSRKQTISFLIKDCPAVFQKFKNKQYKDDDILPIIYDYNNCSALMK